MRLERGENGTGNWKGKKKSKSKNRLLEEMGGSKKKAGRRIGELRLEGEFGMNKVELKDKGRYKDKNYWIEIEMRSIARCVS